MVAAMGWVDDNLRGEFFLGGCIVRSASGHRIQGCFYEGRREEENR